MKYLIVIIYLLSISTCKNIDNKKNASLDKVKFVLEEKEKQDSALTTTIVQNDNLEKGFLFVKISDIYFNNKTLIIYNKNKDVAVSFQNKQIKIGGNSHDIIEDSGKYKNEMDCISFDPEYDVFIMKCIGVRNGFYEIVLNNEIGLIEKKNNSSLVKLKSEKDYLLESYPVLTNKTPLRALPDDTSDIIHGFENYTYIPIEIQGEWLKVKDDKECFIDEPSEKDIIGWVRWKKDGKIIIKIAHTC